MFLIPIPAIKKSRISRQISLEEVSIGEVPKMLTVSFTNVEQQTMWKTETMTAAVTLSLSGISSLIMNATKAAIVRIPI